MKCGVKYTMIADKLSERIKISSQLLFRFSLETFIYILKMSKVHDLPKTEKRMRKFDILQNSFEYSYVKALENILCIFSWVTKLTQYYFLNFFDVVKLDHIWSIIIQYRTSVNAKTNTKTRIFDVIHTIVYYMFKYNTIPLQLKQWPAHMLTIANHKINSNVTYILESRFRRHSFTSVYFVSFIFPQFMAFISYSILFTKHK